MCGPTEPTGAAANVVVWIRRYQCRCCWAVVEVVPSDVAPRRHYSRCAIGLALALFGVAQQSAIVVRTRVSGAREKAGHCAADGWPALRRWIAAARRGALFTHTRAVRRECTARQVAERVAMTLAGYAPPSCATLPLEAQAFIGARAMA